MSESLRSEIMSDAIERYIEQERVIIRQQRIIVMLLVLLMGFGIGLGFLLGGIYG